jgi:hypothetical protein
MKKDENQESARLKTEVFFFKVKQMSTDVLSRLNSSCPNNLDWGPNLWSFYGLRMGEIFDGVAADILTSNEVRNYCYISSLIVLSEVYRKNNTAMFEHMLD